jgi:hypothetical protein
LIPGVRRDRSPALSAIEHVVAAGERAGHYLPTQLSRIFSHPIARVAREPLTRRGDP